jgi:flagellar hook-associated protein 3 FlgL
MKTTFISTSALTEATRLSLIDMQKKLAAAQKEVTTGRLADVGATLGYKTGRTVSLRYEYGRLDTMIDTNGLTSTRLEATQSALNAIVKDAQSLVGQLIGARNNDGGRAGLETQARTSLSAFTDLLNTTVSDTYIFAGINSDVKPLTDYFGTPTPANRQAVADAFFATFGVSPSDPAVANISGEDMQSFLDTTFANLFEEPAWGAWSAASGENVRSRISTSELIDTSTNTNEEAIRKLARAYAMVSDLGVGQLSQGAYEAVVDSAARLAGEAIQGIGSLQGSLSTAQEGITNANARMSLQKDILAKHIGALEGVDPAEASTRVAALTTQIETSYAITARIHQLSLLNWL